MARVRHDFQMRASPPEAEARFLQEIAPELDRNAELRLCRRRPGLLEFAFLREHKTVLTRVTASPPRRILGGPRVRVAFDGSPSGTRVQISGRCARAVCEALSRLGQPGFWPER